jgi:PAN domain
MKRARFSRLLSLLGIAIVLGYSGVTSAQGTPIEYGIDRPGSDRYSFDMVRPEPTDCQAVCLLDQSCRAWTFVRPGFQGPHVRC